jgi:hypothetical protein
MHGPIELTWVSSRIANDSVNSAEASMYMYARSERPDEFLLSASDAAERLHFSGSPGHLEQTHNASDVWCSYGRQAPWQVLDFRKGAWPANCWHYSVLFSQLREGGATVVKQGGETSTRRTFHFVPARP